MEFEDMRWEGDVDGHVVARVDGNDREIDRPGDMVVTMMDSEFASERLKCAAAAYGVCLGMRRLQETAFVPQVIEKTLKFMGSADIQSLELYRTLDGLREFLQANADRDGATLRQLFHQEARRILESSRAER